MKRALLLIIVGALYVLHQDFWFWRAARPLVFGFLPIGLFYHACYTVATSVVIWMLVKHLWPSQLEGVGEEGWGDGARGRGGEKGQGEGARGRGGEKGQGEGARGRGGEKGQGEGARGRGGEGAPRRRVSLSPALPVPSRPIAPSPRRPFSSSEEDAQR